MKNLQKVRYFFFTPGKSINFFRPMTGTSPTRVNATLPGADATGKRVDCDIPVVYLVAK